MNLDALLRIKASVLGEESIRRLGNSMQGLEGRAKNLSMAFAGLRGGVAGLVGLVGGGVIFTKIFGDTATLQSQTKSLEVLTGSARQASQIIKELQSYGAATPFEATDLIETAKRLNAFGVGADRVVEVVKNLGDVAGATGANLTELATAYGQVVAKGRLQGEELLQFQERGVALSAELQKMYKLQGQEFTKALEGGRISAEAVELAIERLTDAGGKYADGAIAQSDTLNGKFSTLKDNITALSQTLGNILAPAMKGILDYAINILDTINKAIKAAINGPQEADTRAAIQAGELPFGGPAALDRIIGEQRRRQLQKQAGPGFLGFGFNTQNFIKLLQQQPEFQDSPAASGTNPRSIPALLDKTDPEAEAKKAAAAAKRAAAEQERLEERRRDLGQKALGLQQQLRQSLEDLNAAYAGVGANEFDELALRRNEAITDNNRLVDQLTRDVVKLALEINEAGGQIDIKPFEDLINKISEGNVALADKEYEQGIKAIGDEAAQAAIGAMEFVDAIELQSQAVQGAKGGISSYLEGIGTLSENISNVALNAFKGLEDAIVSLTTTGKFSFKDFALSIINDLTRMVTRMLIIAPILQFIQSLIPGGGAALSGTKALSTTKLFPTGAFANGGTFANGIQPFAAGGIVDRPTLFKFANGGALRNGLMGEAGPEAIIPLRRGRDGKLGVAGGGGSTSVTVNVDASGGTQVAGNPGQAEALGRAVSQAVQNELIRQKRPGGLLAA